MLSFAFQTQRADFIDNPVEPAAPETKTETRDRPERGQASRPETKTETLSNPRGGLRDPQDTRPETLSNPQGGLRVKTRPTKRLCAINANNKRLNQRDQRSRPRRRSSRK